MIDLRQLDAHRDREWQTGLARNAGTPFGPEDQGGCFRFRSVEGGELRVIAANGDGWDHVFVSRADRIPSWAEMEQVKRLCFKPNEVAYQLHVPTADHINHHPHCLHIWRPHRGSVPLPPKWMIA